jgi:hypothetical protein
MLRDDKGHIVYPNFDINVSAQAGFMQNKSEIMANIVQLASQKAFEPTPGNIAYLKVLQKIGMPYLDKIILDLEQALQKQQEMQEMELQSKQQGQGQPQLEKGSSNSLIDNMPDDLRREFMSLPPEVQQEMMALVSR